MAKGSSVELEADAKRKFSQWIRANAPDYDIIEIKTPGYPDRCIVGPNRFALWLEFKRERGPSKTGAKRQAYYRGRLKGYGFAVEIVTTKTGAITAFRQASRT